MEDLIKKYIQLRDMTAQIEEQAKTKKAKLRAIMDKIEGVILLSFTEQGIDSAKTEGGTAYKTTQTSATVADWTATLPYIQEHQLWDMLEKRVNKSAVEEFRTAHNDNPPGVVWREEIKINIRRPA